jgi:hypothetical protein
MSGGVKMGRSGDQGVLDSTIVLDGVVVHWVENLATAFKPVQGLPHRRPEPTSRHFDSHGQPGTETGRSNTPEPGPLEPKILAARRSTLSHT